MERGRIAASGAGRGIGLRGLERLAEAGYVVYAGVLEPAEKEQLAARHPNIKPFLLDVTKSESLENAAQLISSDLGDSQLTGVWSNAGINCVSPFADMDQSEIASIVSVNLTGAMLFINSLLPLLKPDHSRIVMTGSATGMFAGPGVSVYTSTKFALEGFADALRIEMAQIGISVSLIEPGLVRSPMSEGVRSSVNARLAAMSPEDRKAFGPLIEKIADLSDKASTPDSKVADAVLRAMESTRPRARYRVGADAKAVAVIRHFPDFVKDAIQRAAFGL